MFERPDIVFFSGLLRLLKGELSGWNGWEEDENVGLVSREFDVGAWQYRLWINRTC